MKNKKEDNRFFVLNKKEKNRFFVLNKKEKNKFFVLNKKAQGVFGMSFGMIFSIILIIFFIIVAFIAIKAFLNTQKCAQIGIFASDLQDEVDKTWNSQKADFEFKARLPTKIKYVCFANLDDSITATGIMGNIGRELGRYQGYVANLFLYPPENACDMVAHDINHIDLDKIISQKNPYCVVVDDGNINLHISKDFSDRLVNLD